MIEVRDLSKSYGDKLAVDQLTFNVRPGMVTGFLGPNGAGKSTTMRVILGLDRPTAGSATVNGKAYRDHAAPLREVGAILEARAIHTGRTAYTHLVALAQTHGIPRSRVDEVIALVGLQDVAHKRVGSFSLGMGQRLGIAAALLGDPKTLILDEPSNGLDPEGIRWIRNLLRSLAAEGRTVFVSSHLMSEMSMMADWLIVVGRGRLIADSTVEGFVKLASGEAVRVRTPDAARLRSLAEAVDGVTVTASDDGDGSVLSLAGHLECSSRRARCGQHHRAPRAHAGAGIARGGVHAPDPQLGGVSSGAHARRDTGGSGSMSAVANRTGGEHAAPLPGVSLGRVVRSEWTKLWSLRSTRWSLLVSVVAMAGLGILVSAVQMAHWNQMSFDDRASFDPVDVSLGGWHVAQLAIGVLGVLLITGEYSTGQIRSTFAAVPRRLPVLWAKAGVYAAITFVLMVAASFTAFLVSQPILRRHHVDTTLSSPHVLRAVIGAALFLTVTGLLGVSLGALVRNTAGGIATFAGLMFVLPGITAILPHSWGDSIDPYLPLSAGTDILTIHHDPSALSAWPGFLLFLGYALAALALSAILLVRRDV